jgi:hypothetical protein
VKQSLQSDAFVITWTQLRVDGVRPGSQVEFADGVRVTWHGRRIDFPGGALTTEHTIARAVTRLAGRERFRDGMCREEPLVENQLVLTNGTHFFQALVVRTLELSRPFLIFLGELPPQKQDLFVYTGPVPARAEPVEPDVHDTEAQTAIASVGRSR